MTVAEKAAPAARKARAWGAMARRVRGVKPRANAPGILGGKASERI
jgi:hypothetical protein